MTAMLPQTVQALPAPSIATGRTVLVSIGVMIVVLVAITAISGHDAELGTAMMIVMGCAVLLWGMSHTSQVSNLGRYPWNP